MDQKNTIVKCKAYPNCLFNYNGVCDNYVINIGVDGKCDCYVETESVKEQKTCHPDCIHFDDSDIMVGPICLFKHPEPLKDFFEGMPCDYYHSTNCTRGQRTKSSIYDNVYNYEPFLTKAICSQCKYDTHGNLCSRKNVASNGIWTCWEKKE